MKLFITNYDKIIINYDRTIIIMHQIAAKIPVVIRALGLIKKGLQKYVQRITGNIKIHELQLQMGGSHYLEHLIYCILIFIE